MGFSRVVHRLIIKRQADGQVDEALPRPPIPHGWRSRRQMGAKYTRDFSREAGIWPGAHLASHFMAADTVGTTRTRLELKSASLPVVAVLLRSPDAAQLAADLAERLDSDPGFFDQDAVLIDLALLRETEEPLNFPALCAALRAHSTLPVAVRGGNTAQMAAAAAAGLAPAPDAAPHRTEVSPREVVREVQVEVPIEVPVPGPGTMVIDKPLRSGQQVYARGADLVVLAVVSYGAEVIADGNIHVYAPLRGRAMAGARGNTSARIFTTCLEPQLVSIAGIYRTTEVAMPPEVQGKPAQVRLDGEKLLIEPL